MERLVKVTGIGRIAVKPNTIILNLPLSQVDQVYRNSIQMLNREVSMLKDIISKNGLAKDEVKTLDYRIERKTTWNDKTKECDFVGYSASHDMEVEFPFDLDRLNSIATDLSNQLAGVNLTVSFGVKESEKHNRDLIEKAVSDAQKNARYLAHASGIDLGLIQSVVYAFEEVIFRSESYSTSDYSGELLDNMIDVNPADIKAEKNVTITWEID
ncbi:MAG: hypothetical protein ACI84C_002875 [Flavobacteriales bacterium]|jgi:uncharacterized protein YggE